jgi:hypothetical protein
MDNIRDYINKVDIRKKNAVDVLAHIINLKYEINEDIFLAICKLYGDKFSYNWQDRSRVIEEFFNYLININFIPTYKVIRKIYEIIPIITNTEKMNNTVYNLVEIGFLNGIKPTVDLLSMTYNYHPENNYHRSMSQDKYIDLLLEHGLELDYKNFLSLLKRNILVKMEYLLKFNFTYHKDFYDICFEKRYVVEYLKWIELPLNITTEFLEEACEKTKNIHLIKLFVNTYNIIPSQKAFENAHKIKNNNTIIKFLKSNNKNLYTSLDCLNNFINKYIPHTYKNILEDFSNDNIITKKVKEVEVEVKEEDVVVEVKEEEQDNKKGKNKKKNMVIVKKKV